MSMVADESQNAEEVYEYFLDKIVKKIYIEEGISSLNEREQG